jgi:sugar/nucleoside kinase (ribokinase family)
MYVAAGHLTTDVLADGRHRAGGTVLFGAIAAILRGRPAHVVTAAAEDIEDLVPVVDGLSFTRTPAEATTTFVNRGDDRERVQELLAWAGPVPVGSGADVAGVVHLGPVAQELEPTWLDACPDEAIVVLTPQGLIRSWGEDPAVFHRMIDEAWIRAVRRRLVVVLNASELAWVGELGERVVKVGGALIVTDGPRPATVRTRGGAIELAPAVVDLADDTGAGDVFAAVIGLELARGARLTAAVQTAHGAVGELLPQIQALLPVRSPAT